MRECPLTRWCDRMLFGPAYRLVFLPLDLARGRRWPAKLAAITIGWLWMMPMLFLVMGILILPTMAGGIWDMTQDDA